MISDKPFDGILRYRDIVTDPTRESRPFRVKTHQYMVYQTVGDSPLIAVAPFDGTHPQTRCCRWMDKNELVPSGKRYEGTL